MSPKQPPVTWTVDDRGIATLVIAREHGNAINGPFVDAMMHAAQELEAAAEVRGVLLTASGKMFCPGLDLQELLPLDRAAMQRFMERFNACVVNLFTFPKPMVAALNGHALAGGFILALTADWRVLRRGSLVGLNEIKVGVPLPYGVALLLRETVPANRLEEVALLGRNYADEDAVAAGLVRETAPEDAFDDVCRARIEEFATKDGLAFATTKRYLRSQITERMRANGPVLVGEFLDAWFSPGTRGRMEQIVADLGKRGGA